MQTTSTQTTNNLADLVSVNLPSAISQLRDDAELAAGGTAGFRADPEDVAVQLLGQQLSAGGV